MAGNGIQHEQRSKENLGLLPEETDKKHHYTEITNPRPAIRAITEETMKSIIFAYTIAALTIAACLIKF